MAEKMRVVWARAAFGWAVGAALCLLSAQASAQTPQACANPQEACGSSLSRDCLSSLGAGALPVGEADDCAGQMRDYRMCLASIAENCPGARPQQGPSTEASIEFEELARLGGLIAEPETAVEHYNNALVYARRGDLLNGRKMIEKAIALGADQIDVHQRYAQLLKAQEGLIGAREIMADLARRAPDNRGAALAEASLRPGPQRQAALEALVAGDDPFAPAYYELAALSAADRVGQQSLTDQRAEKAALEAFSAADERGQVYRWFLDKDAVEVWRESARRRLAAYANRNLDVAPVSLTASASNDGWILTFMLVEPARRIRYRVDGGPVQDTGLTPAINPLTGEPMPRGFVTLPLGVASARIDVWYDNIRGEEEGPFPLEFSAADAFTASARQVLDQTQNWVKARAWDEGSQLIYFTHLVSYRCGLSGIRYGVDTEAPDTEFPLTPCDPRNPYAIADGQEIYLTFEQPIDFITVQVTYADGEPSEIRKFDLGG